MLLEASPEKLLLRRAPLAFQCLFCCPVCLHFLPEQPNGLEGWLLVLVCHCSHQVVLSELSAYLACLDTKTANQLLCLRWNGSLKDFCQAFSGLWHLWALNRLDPDVCPNQNQVVQTHRIQSTIHQRKEGIWCGKVFFVLCLAQHFECSSHDHHHILHGLCYCHGASEVAYISVQPDASV